MASADELLARTRALSREVTKMARLDDSRGVSRIARLLVATSSLGFATLGGLAAQRQAPSGEFARPKYQLLRRLPAEWVDGV